MDETWLFNGVNGTTGHYLLPEMSTEHVARLAQGEAFGEEELLELRQRFLGEEIITLGVREGIDPTLLHESGWGVIFAQQGEEQLEDIRDALKPLLDLRRKLAGPLYREFLGADGYRPGDTKTTFLKRHGKGPGAADPAVVPYYLLLVGSPALIPYQFQYQLDVAHAVGRLHFDSVDDYARYARSVVAAEDGRMPRDRSLALFGVQNPADRATQRSVKHLVQPLSQRLKLNTKGYAIREYIKEKASKADLKAILAAEKGPALLLTASHGMGFSPRDPRQVHHQGALLCQDWPGPLQALGKAIPPEQYFSGDDLADAHVAGLISFHFACYSAGTPRLDDFPGATFIPPQEIAPSPFVAGLPKGLLARGALAVIGHVERAWAYSFGWPGAGAQTAVFEDTLLRLMKGQPVGHAMEYFNERYAELSTVLSDDLKAIQLGEQADKRSLAENWTANNDARSYVIIGDPAVRVCAA